MGISRLNSFFTKHHRIIFGVFAVLIIIAFVFADWVGGGGGGCSVFGSNDPASQQTAEVFGQTTNRADFEDQYRLTQLDIYLTYNGMRLPEEYIQQLTMQRITAKALAKRYNIEISDEEVAQQIFKNFPGKDGKFDKEAYQKFIDNFLTQQGFTEDDLNEIFRHQLLAQKLADIQSNTAPVSENEMKAFYNMLYQQLNVYTAMIEVKDFESKVKVDDVAIAEFFKLNRNLFTMPAVLEAMVVEFAPAQYLAQVEVSEKEVKDYYEANKEFLSKVKDKDGKEVAPAFDQVKAEITAQLKNNKAMNKAREEAQKFTSEVYDLINELEADKRAAAFKEIAADKQLKVVATGKFNANADKAGAVGDRALVAGLAAADLELPLTEAIESNQAAYVGFVTGYVPSRPAELDEVKDQVKTQFIQAEALKLARQRAVELADNLRKLPAEGKAMRLASKDSAFQALPVATVRDYMVQQDQLQQQLQMYMQFGAPQEAVQMMQKQLAIPQMIINMQAGEVSAPQESMAGFQIIYMAERKAPAQPFAVNDQIKMECQAFKANNAVMAFGLFTQANSKLMLAQPEQEEAAAE